MNHAFREALAQALADLDQVDPDRAELAVGPLRDAIQHLGEAFNEALGEAALAGRSVRQLASEAGMAPNSIPPRLGASHALASYAEGGRVSGDALARARYDRRQPMRFTRHRPPDLQ
ncbi:MAG: hypothetical protein Q4G45_04175 [Actinomycetia bacterium]|nr:hypothetical protein [Actinomycetes bacterium]